MMSHNVSNTINKCLRQMKWCQSYSRCFSSHICTRTALYSQHSVSQKPIQYLATISSLQYRSLSTSEETSSISFPEYEVVCNETLESLTDYFDVLVEQNTELINSDVTYGDGVLTVNFGDPYGTYVINRQSPNKQIWLSSPTSGPKRYDYDVGNNAWVYKYDTKSLHDLLQEEISAIIGSKLDFYSNCSHSGKHN
uniref:ferroxidase n=1 Tax=Cacopsylla melanoneura TaxID=428564 RepID=A0A8D9BSM3_9HEMI